MVTNTIYQGNALTVLKSLPSNTVDCVVTSPPYWGLRNYGKDANDIWDGDSNCDHEWSAYYRPGITGGTATPVNNHIVLGDEQKFCVKCGAWYGMLGLEPLISLYIKHLCDIFDEIKRVLKSTGTCWVNLGDTYYSISGGMYLNDQISSAKLNIDKGLDKSNALRKNKELPQKCLSMIPARFAIEMIDRGWTLRNEIVWWKPNVLPSSQRDRFTVDFEKFFFFTKSQKYFFDQQFENYSINSNMAYRKSMGFGRYYRTDNPEDDNAILDDDRQSFYNPRGRIMRTVWHISTEPMAEAHFATFPLRLIKVPIISGCPEFVCSKCGKPRYKNYKLLKSNMDVPYYGTDTKDYEAEGLQSSADTKRRIMEAMMKVREFDGYTECNCGVVYEPGIVLDPFMGSGTTALAAKKLGRRWIGIEINTDYIDIINKRLDTKQLELF